MGSAINVVTDYLRAFSRSDADVIAGYVAEGFRNEHLSSLGSSCVGRDEYRRRLPHFLAAFADRSYTIEDLVEQERDESTDVVVRYRFAARYEELDIEIPGVMWFTVHDGVITKRVDVWDSKTFLEQTDHANPES